LTFGDYDDMENMRLSLELSVTGVVEINVKKSLNYLRQILLYEVMNVYSTVYDRVFSIWFSTVSIKKIKECR